MYSEGCKGVAAGMNPMDLRKGVQMAVDQVIEDLAKMSQPTEVSAFVKSSSPPFVPAACVAGHSSRLILIGAYDSRRRASVTWRRSRPTATRRWAA